jgi:hypothetical protein
MSEETPSTDVTATPRKRRTGLYVLLLLVMAAAVTFVALQTHKHSINSSVQAALAGETGAQTAVYRRDLLGGNDIVFDVQSVSGEMSMADMTRRLLKTADALKRSEFKRVYLAYHGQEKFYFEGSYFKQVGEEYGSENPIYTLRTMPENVHNLDGSPAFETWTGGLLGVLGQQMDDVNQFHRKWWANDTLADLD